MSVDQAIRTLTWRIKAATVEMRVGLALRVLERRYRPDQPRMPAGTPEGGQWTVDGAGHGRQVAAGFGRVVFHGVVIRQNYNSTLDQTECWFYDRREDYRFMKTWPGRTDCPVGYIF